MATAEKLILAFVLLIIGVVLLGTVSSQINTAVSKTQSAETISIVTAFNANRTINESTKFYPAKVTASTTGWRVDIDGCQADDTILGVYTNSSGYAFVKDTDYVTNSAGYFTLKNTAIVNGTNPATNTTIAYITYCPDDYLTQAWNRNLLVIVPGLFAIAILGVSIGMFYSVGKETGLIG